MPQLGQKAAELVAEAEAGGPQLGAAVAAALEPLFLRQVRAPSAESDRGWAEVGGWQSPR